MLLALTIHIHVRAKAFFPIRDGPPALNSFWRLRPRGQSAVIPATGVTLASRTPDRRRDAGSSAPRFRPAPWFSHALLILGQPEKKSP
jgi:hypothetical protein